MRKVFYIVEKEFRQILRDKMILAIIFSVPIFQLLLLPWAVNLDVKHLSIAVVDLDKSSYSRELISKFTASESFDLDYYGESYRDAMNELQNDHADIVITIPANFERDLIRSNINKTGEEGEIAVAINAIDGVKAVLGAYYLNMIVRDFHHSLIVEWYPQFEEYARGSIFDYHPTTWFNPLADYKHFMVPAILVLLVTVSGTFLTSLNIVKEKEIGTIEQINVTPIKKWEFILGKLIPFWVIANIIFSIGLFMLRFIYGIPVLGNISTLYLLANIYMVVILSMGLFISTFAATQQQSMFLGNFFIMLFIMLSGLFTSIESMPDWAKALSHSLPITYFIIAVRSIILKGANWADISDIVLYLCGFAVLFSVLAVLKYSKKV